MRKRGWFCLLLVLALGAGLMPAQAAELIVGEQVRLQLEDAHADYVDGLYRTPSGGYYIAWCDVWGQADEYTHYWEALVNADGSLLWQEEYATPEGDNDDVMFASYRDASGWVMQHIEGLSGGMLRLVARDWTGRKRWATGWQSVDEDDEYSVSSVSGWLLTQWVDRGEHGQIAVRPLTGGEEHVYPLNAWTPGSICTFGDQLAILSEEEGKTICRFFDSAGVLQGSVEAPFAMAEDDKTLWLTAKIWRNADGGLFLVLYRQGKGRYRDQGTCTCWTLKPGEEAFTPRWEVTIPDHSFYASGGHAAVIGSETLLMYDNEGVLYLLTSEGAEEVPLVGAKAMRLLTPERDEELPVLILQDSEGTLWAQEVLGAEQDEW